MKPTMQSTLQSVGVSPHYCGYRYFILAVTMAAEKPWRLQNIRREIYIPIAEACHASSATVEKNLRTIRDVMIRNGALTLLSKMTGSSWPGRPPYPREIIEAFAEYFSEELIGADQNQSSF
ncbi:MAG: hypothetical protein HFI63_11625 [Lachnospiraceae bacterium]|nr:hypothetical protein [Lachnospiraceae bacterium]